MNKINEQSGFFRSGHTIPGLIFVAAFVGSGCNKLPDRPMPPQAPPKPQASVENLPFNVQNALFTFSSKSSLDPIEAQGASIKHHVIRT